MSFKSQPRKSKRRGVLLPSASPRSSWGGHKLWFLFSVYLFEPKRTLKTQSIPPSSTFPTGILFLLHPLGVPTTHPGHSSRPNFYFPKKSLCLPYQPEAYTVGPNSSSRCGPHHQPVTFNPRSLGRLLPHSPLRKESNFRLGVRRQRVTPQTLSCREPRLKARGQGRGRGRPEHFRQCSAEAWLARPVGAGAVGTAAIGRGP